MKGRVHLVENVFNESTIQSICMFLNFVHIHVFMKTNKHIMKTILRISNYNIIKTSLMTESQNRFKNKTGQFLKSIICDYIKNSGGVISGFFLLSILNEKVSFN